MNTSDLIKAIKGNKLKVIVGIIFLIVIVTRFAPLLLFETSLSWDESIYLSKGQDIARYGQFERNCTMKSQKRPTGLPVMVAGFYKLGINPLFVAPLFGCLLFVAWLLLSKIYSDELVLISMIILAFNPFLWFLSTRPLIDIFATFFTFVVIVSSYLGLEKDRKYFLVAAIAAAIGFQAHYIVGVVTLGVGLWVLWKKKFEPLKSKYFIISSFLFILITVLWSQVFVFGSYGSGEGYLAYPTEAVNSILKAVFSLSLSAKPVFFVFSVLALGTVITPLFLKFLIGKKNTFEKLSLWCIALLFFTYTIKSIGTSASDPTWAGLRNTFRYMLPIAPFTILFASKELKKVLSKERLYYFTIVACLVNFILFVPLFSMYNNRPKNEMVRKGLENLELERGIIFSSSPTYSCYRFPDSDSFSLNETKVENTMGYNEKVYLILVSYESDWPLPWKVRKSVPEWAGNYTTESKLIHRYHNENKNSVKVYQIK